ncbi:AHH domain-containing protein [Archangium sp.]|uniref:AHH domain-containing protein n=1 Tax=Archangium sp. TaxID=1872627 RepID=UPI002D6CFEB5|nr:AHH domain-containing protein [Archangium sp.]HYO55120.1 AHH domain-containing protein [Archangium sp.]
MPLRSLLALLLLVLLPVTARANAMEGQVFRVEIPVDARGHWEPQGGYSVSLTFPLRPLTPKDMAPLSHEDVRAILTAFEGVYGKVAPHPAGERKEPTCVKASLQGVLGGLMPCPPDTQSQEKSKPKRVLPPQVEERIRQDYTRFYSSKNAAPLDGLGPVEDSRFFLALKRAPKHMGTGAQQADEELFTSPVFIASMAVSMTLYMVALAAPEPFISKGAVAAMTFWLMATYGFSEVVAVASAVKRLYDESSAAMSERALDDAARHFGEAIGGVGLRILVTVAVGRLAGKLPEVPKAPGSGGLWDKSLARLVSLWASTVTLVADGTILLMGAMLGASASAVKDALKAARVSGDCAPKKGDDHEGHHLATDKNEESNRNGGPWTPRFKQFFDRAGLSLNDLVNIVFLKGHKGPHPEEYHDEIFRRIREALGACKIKSDCRSRLEDVLDKIAADVCTPDSRLNKLATKKK